MLDKTRITNEKVFRIVGETKNFLKTEKTRKPKLIGHILLHNSLLRIIENTINGNNSRGVTSPEHYISQIVRNIDCRP